MEKMVKMQSIIERFTNSIQECVDEKGEQIKPPWVATALIVGLVLIGFVMDFFHII